MRAEGNSLRVIEEIAHLSEHCTVLFRYRVSDSVRQIEDGCSRVDGHAADLAKKIDIRTSCILGRELHFTHTLPPVADHRANGFKRLLTRHVQLHAEMQIR